MPIGPFELAIMCCLALPVMAAIVAVVLIQRRNSDSAATPHTRVTYAPSGQFPCPHCHTILPAETDICPNCGEPQAMARDALQRTASMTGIPYEDLLQQARLRSRSPDNHSG